MSDLNQDKHSLNIDEITGQPGGLSYEQPVIQVEQGTPSDHIQPPTPSLSVESLTPDILDSIPRFVNPGQEMDKHNTPDELQKPLINLHPGSNNEVPKQETDAIQALPRTAIAKPPQKANKLALAKQIVNKSKSKGASNRKQRLRMLGYGVSSFALILIILNFSIISQQINYFIHPPKVNKNVTLQNPNAQQASTAAIVAPENVIIIPKINVSAPIIFADSNAEGDILKDLQDGVVHYDGTANPGQVGNVSIFGHSSNDWWEPGNYKFVFALLDKLAVGDQIQINFSSHRYIYQVSETKVVQPTDVGVLNPTSDNTLTLITCTPPGTSWRRLIIVAKQIEPAQKSTAPILTEATPAPKPVVKPAPLPGNAPSLGYQVSKFFQGIVSFFTPKPSQKPAPATPSSNHLPEVS